MLVLLGPTFGGSNDEYARLARVTGMVAYDLRTKLKPGIWGVVRALADAEQAEELGARLREEKFQVAVLDPAVGQDAERPVATARSIKLEADQVVMALRQREITVPYGALLTVIRGEVRTGKPTGRTPSWSSATLRAVNPSAGDVAALRASGSGQFDAFAAADIHFITVKWVTRVDPRRFDFGEFGGEGQSHVQSLDRLVEALAERARIPVDRGNRVSSLASFVGLGPGRTDTPSPSSSPRIPGEGPQDEQFDAYSRLVAEAERQTRHFRDHRDS
jgi:hypothetical protein